MTRNLDNLPFDVLFEVARYLALEDVVALGCVSWQLRAALRGEETLARMVLKNNAPFAREALPASSEFPSASSPTPQDARTTSFRSALLGIHARRTAYATASPRSACVVDSGASDFLSSEGVLCYVYSQPQQGGADAVEIRVLDLEDGGREVAVLDVDAVVRRVVESVCEEGDGGDGDEVVARKRRNAGRREERQKDDPDAIQECRMAHRAAANLGFEGPLWENSVGPAATRSRSGSPCSPGGWSTVSSSSSCSSASSRGTDVSRRDGRFSYPTPRVTLVHYSAAILSVYVNFSASMSCSPASASRSLRCHPHYLVAIRIPTTTNTPTTLRVFRLPNRAGGYGSDNATDRNFGSSNDSKGSGTVSAAGESDGAGRGLKLFVRNTAAHYYFGTHTGRGSDGKRVWVVHGVELETLEKKRARGAETTKTADEEINRSDDGGEKSPNGKRKGETARISLPQISSTALGVDTCFFIHGAYFHGLTSSFSATATALGQFPISAGESTTPEHRQHDLHVSYYTSLRFPLASPSPDAVEVNARVFRRHHGLEGPINDAWTALEAVVDERDGEVRVVEERREWMPMRGGRSGGGGRSWYLGDLGFGGEREEQAEGEGREGDINLEDRDARRDSGSATSNLRASAAHTPLAHRSVDPYDASPLDAFLPDLDLELSSDGTHDHERPWLRHPQSVHRECFHDDAARSFTLSRTKHRVYNYSAAAFLDLVEDERCCAGSSGGPCLRLRVGARRQRASREAAAGGDDGPRNGEDEMHRQGDEYVHGRVRMWPPVFSSSAAGGRTGCQCEARLHAIMNAPLPAQSSSSFAPSQGIDVVAMTDERSMVFLRRPKYGGAMARTGPLVLVGFDDRIAARGVDGLSWKRTRCCG